MSTSTETVTKAPKPAVVEGSNGSTDPIHGSTGAVDVAMEGAENKGDNTTDNSPEKSISQIKRIMECQESDHARILGIEENASSNVAEIAWVNLGCMIHPRFAKYDDAETAFTRLFSAAEKLEVNEVYLDAVNDWDGKEDIMHEERKTMDSIPKPPDRVNQIYGQATPIIYSLASYPESQEVIQKLNHLNSEIIAGNETAGAVEAERFQWQIPLSQLIVQYQDAVKRYRILDENPIDERATIDLKNVASLVKKILDSHHLPESWRVLNAEEYFKSKGPDLLNHISKTNQEMDELVRLFKDKTQGLSGLNEEMKTRVQTTEHSIKAEAERVQSAVELAKIASQNTNVAEGMNELMKACNEVSEAKNAAETAFNAIFGISQDSQSISYPWPTYKTDDGSLIIGVRNWGRGTQVCTEKQEADGKIVRRLESTTDAGLGEEVKMYKESEQHKDLSRGQSEWSYKNRPDFEKLLWVAVSYVKRRNTAGNTKSANADCCVKFKTEGICMLTLSSLVRVLGEVAARRKIEMWCQENDVVSPWEVKPITTFNDPLAVEKSPQKRRQMMDAQTRRSANTISNQDSISKTVERRGSPELENKVAGLEARLTIIEEKVNSLEVMNSKLDQLIAMMGSRQV